MDPGIENPQVQKMHPGKISRDRKTPGSKNASRDRIPGSIRTPLRFTNLQSDVKFPV